MNIPDTEIEEIILTWNVRLRFGVGGKGDKVTVVDGSGHHSYIDEFGTTSWNKCSLFDSFDAAYAFAVKIKDFFARPLTKEEIRTYRDENLKGENKEDIKDYRKFYKLVLAEKWEEAAKFMRSLDTFVRDGVPARIRHEIDKHLEEGK
jgi:hypothetical protein